jgi:hypothetical protein
LRSIAAPLHRNKKRPVTDAHFESAHLLRALLKLVVRVELFGYPDHSG